MLSHDVYFTLANPSDEAIAALVADCRHYLDGHDGVVFFAAGTLEPELARPVNDRAFHVALHVVFDSRASHDRYQTDPRHLEFIARNKPTWAHVRVFDSDC